MKYFVVAGERSGDLHGSNLIKALKNVDKNARIECWGGDMMEQSGATLRQHYKEMAIMAIWEVLLKLSQLLGRIKKCQEDIEAFGPDVVILIDFGGFNLRLAKRLKAKGIPVYYYISPKIWAWNTNRAYKIRQYVDKMFCIMPFEQEFYKRFNYEVDYVGNPVVDAVNQFIPTKSKEDFLHIGGIRKMVALLPGSRKQEVMKMTPVFKEVIQFFPDVIFVVAGVRNLEESLYKPLENLHNTQVVYEENYNILANADAALVTSGTATLETALFNVPQVVVYKTSGVSYAFGKMVIKVPYISLVNLIAGKELVKELIQGDCTPSNVTKALKKVLYEEAYIQEMTSEYEEIRKILGNEVASEKAARLIVGYLS